MEQHSHPAQPPTSEILQLLKAACPTPEDTPFFNHCMTLAKAQGMSWVEGLHYVIHCRNETPS